MRQAVRHVVAFTWAWVNITPKAESQVFRVEGAHALLLQPRRVASFHNFFLPTNKQHRATPPGLKANE
jgi:hypothetical protein